MHAATIVCLIVLTLGVGAARAQETPQRGGAEILAPFKRELQQALLDGLARGPVEAIDACRVTAPAIAESLSGNGVRVGRTSHRLRNPTNVAPEWVAKILEAYAADPSARIPRTVSLAGDRGGYVEPIVVQPLCLTCHGSELAPDVAAAIDELYPTDRAVGYAVGDLRGLFWTEFPLTPGNQ